MIETERLILRRWREADREPYAALCADPEVTEWLGGPFSRGQADARMDRSEAAFETHGFGRFAVERKADSLLVGYCGLMPTHENLPLAGTVEIGWGLAGHAWGQGYASEAARAAVRDGFERAGLAEILAFTARPNLRSQAVMSRVGFVRDAARDFENPNLEPGHPLRPHLVYAAIRPAAPSGRS